MLYMAKIKHNWKVCRFIFCLFVFSLIQPCILKDELKSSVWWDRNMLNLSKVSVLETIFSQRITLNFSPVGKMIYARLFMNCFQASGKLFVIKDLFRKKRKLFVRKETRKKQPTETEEKNNQQTCQKYLLIRNAIVNLLHSTIGNTIQTNVDILVQCSINA